MQPTCIVICYCIEVILPKCPFSNWFAWSHTTLFSKEHALDSIAVIYRGKSKGLCSSYLFTVHNTKVYTYLSDRKVSFVNSDIFCVNFFIEKKKRFCPTSAVIKQLRYSKCLLIPAWARTKCLSLKLCKYKAIVSGKKTMRSFSLAADISKALNSSIQRLKPPLFRLTKLGHR